MELRRVETECETVNTIRRSFCYYYYYFFLEVLTKEETFFKPG